MLTFVGRLCWTVDSDVEIPKVIFVRNCINPGNTIQVNMVG